MQFAIQQSKMGDDRPALLDQQTIRRFVGGILQLSLEFRHSRLVRNALQEVMDRNVVARAGGHHGPSR